jgi:hypothetical protein
VTPGDAEQILWRALQDLKKSFKFRRRQMRRPDGERGRHPPGSISRQPDG